MSSIKVYTLRDSKSEVFNTPWYQNTHGEAERFVKSLLGEDPKQLPGYYANVAKFPEDFDLYHLGEYDSSTGIMKVYDSPRHMLKVLQLKQVPN